MSSPNRSRRGGGGAVLPPSSVAAASHHHQPFPQNPHAAHDHHFATAMDTSSPQQQQQRKEIYTYDAPWTVFSLAWSNRCVSLYFGRSSCVSTELLDIILYMHNNLPTRLLTDPRLASCISHSFSPSRRI